MKKDLKQRIEWRRRELAAMEAKLKAGDYDGKGRETVFQEMYSIIKRQLVDLESKLQKAA